MGRILCLRLFILLPTPRFALSVLRVNKTVVLLTRKNWTRMGPAWEHHHVCKKKQIAVRILRLRLFILLPTPSSLSPSLSPSLSLSLSLSFSSLSIIIWTREKKRCLLCLRACRRGSFDRAPHGQALPVSVSVPLRPFVFVQCYATKKHTQHA